MLLKAALGAFGFLQLKASFVVPKPAIKRTAKTTNIILAYFFEFISPANPPKSPGAGYHIIFNRPDNSAFWPLAATVLIGNRSNRNANLSCRSIGA